MTPIPDFTRYDSYQLQAILALGCDAPKNNGKNCSTAQLKSFQQYRLDTMAALKACGLYRKRAGYGIFNDVRLLPLAPDLATLLTLILTFSPNTAILLNLTLFKTF